MNAERLCRELGPGLLRPLVAPVRGGPEIASIVICGLPEDVTESDRDSVVLAVGASTPEACAAIVAAAARHGAAAVVVKSHEAVDAATRELAGDAAVALLSIDREVSWTRLQELIASAVGTPRGSDLLPPAVAASGDLFALADATAHACGAPVTIEDPTSQVLAFSREGQDVDPVRVATILGRRVPGRWATALRHQAELDGVLAQDEPAVIGLPGMAPRRLIAIRSGGVLLGSIWLAGPTDDSADDVLREAAAVAALQLLRRRAERELEHAARSATVRDLLLTGELPARAEEETGLRASDAFAVLAVELDDGHPDGDAAAHDQLADLLAAHLRAFRRRSVHGVLDGRGYVVVACTGPEEQEALLARLQDGLTRAQRTIGSQARAGFGAIAPAPAALPDARATADRALTLGGGGDDGAIATFDGVRAAALVEDVERFVGGWREGRSAELRTLLEHDRIHGTELTETVRLVLELFGDTSTAARRLHVHANTVRYRLRQASELTGIRLGDGTARLALELELRALAEERDGAR